MLKITIKMCRELKLNKNKQSFRQIIKKLQTKKGWRRKEIKKLQIDGSGILNTYRQNKNFIFSELLQVFKN